jgi:hypothetical protein
MGDLFDCPLSPGTLATLLKGCAGELIGAELIIKEGLRESAVLGVDETGLRVRGRQDWVHVAATGKLTLLVHDKRRGQPAISGSTSCRGTRACVCTTVLALTTSIGSAGTLNVTRTSCGS